MSYNNVPDDWNQHYVVCPYCLIRYHASEGGCSCGGPEVFCDSCDDALGGEYYEEFETRGGERLCKKCADEWDHTCEYCGDLHDDDLIRCPISSTKDKSFMVCPSCSDRGTIKC